MSEHINLADIRTAILRTKDRNETPTLITIGGKDFFLLQSDEEFMLNLKTIRVEDFFGYQIFGIDLHADRFRPAGYLNVESSSEISEKKFRAEYEGVFTPTPCARIDQQRKHCPEVAKYRDDYQDYICDICYKNLKLQKL